MLFATHSVLDFHYWMFLSANKRIVTVLHLCSCNWKVFLLISVMHSSILPDLLMVTVTTYCDIFIQVFYSFCALKGSILSFCRVQWYSRIPTIVEQSDLHCSSLLRDICCSFVSFKLCFFVWEYCYCQLARRTVSQLILVHPHSYHCHVIANVRSVFFWAKWDQSID